MFYFFVADSGEMTLSPLIDDKHLAEEAEVLRPGLPLSFAQSLLGEIDEQRKGARRAGIWPLWGGYSREKAEDKKRDGAWVKRAILRTLKGYPGLRDQNWRWEKGNSPEASWQNGLKDNLRSITDKERVGDFLARTEGRLLAKADLQRLGQECSLSYPEILNLCHEQARKGDAQWIPAVAREGKGWRCERCGETKVEEWISIYGPVATCPACTALGAVSSLHELYRSGGASQTMVSSSTKADHLGYSSFSDCGNIAWVFSPRWELSPAQKIAAQQVLAFVKEGAGERGVIQEANSKNETLLWAACGAGKTEVCFPAAAWALEQGKKVLFAAPRQDVVLDVAPRLQQDFPGLTLSVLTGTSQERFTPAPFVLATTHQILRFSQAFDLIFLDEMDAFPYYGSTALAWGMERALRTGGKTVYLTATPSQESLEKVKAGRMKLIRLTARHHGKAVPVPQWRKIGGSMAPEHGCSGEQGEKVFQWLKELALWGPVLLFVPKISWVNPWVEILKKEFPQWSISGSYSADPSRAEKIAALREGKFRIFVCTSILERGVTLPDAQIMVLEADHGVFDERALVQMAGRVGRTQENPSGNALFLSRQKTSSIEKALDWIKEQNELAFAQGLIDN
ncbi:helicase-related protein [Desulfitobacterium chlororespirans]|uniref:Competence protein ComFA n=1 Tax=Desulfitobacterium chlororespirans DSM 11544 TaxID=1121395 RepID=A0A1M7TC73_9FIRM|nr:helicase-related protein [Desulfitobacterium chlororespirans]SHN68286.1 competence protein ComFA [Desulfitobacterium chlororespirans DSM 11544]